MKQVGIWLDKQEANGIVLQNDKLSAFNIESELEFFNPKGGSRSKTRWGPQDVVQDSKYSEREKHQLKKYFQEIVNAIADADQVAIFGPAEAPEKLMAELKENYPDVASKVKTVERKDSMSENQFKAMVKETFGMDARYT